MAPEGLQEELLISGISIVDVSNYTQIYLSGQIASNALMSGLEFQCGLMSISTAIGHSKSEGFTRGFLVLRSDLYALRVTGLV